MLSWTGSRAYLTWMMNKMMGFFESYTDGSSPSRIPPCGLARSVLEALAALTVLVTTHFMDEAEYCDRISLIYRGRSIALGTPDKLKARVVTPENPDPTMEDAFIALVQASDKAQSDEWVAA